MLIPLLQSYGSLVAFGLFLGIADAGNYILLPVLTFDLMGAEKMPMAWGFMLTVNAVSCLGPPFAGRFTAADVIVVTVLILKLEECKPCQYSPTMTESAQNVVFFGRCAEFASLSLHEGTSYK